MSISLIVLFPLLGALLNRALALTATLKGKPVSRFWVNLFGVGFPFLAFICAVKLSWPFLFQERSAPLTETLFSWISVANFHVSVGFALDRLSVLLTLIITGVGTMIHLYSTGYMKEDEGYGCYFSYLNLFLSSMLTLVLGDSLLMMFLGWEGVGLCSYLLIGFWFEDPAKAYAGKKAFVVNRIGDFGFLLGIFVILSVLLPGVQGEQNVLQFSYLKNHAPLLAGMATCITALLFVGATGKSAQIPLYVWLPDAMAGPTPVSALIHAATMVTAGLYMIARLDFLFDMAPKTLEVIAWVGGLTAFFAATIGVTQNDIKKVLAYSTVSQLGYMFLSMGVGAYTTGVFHLMTHAFFKACLFLGAGSVIHALSGEQDIRRMGGLRKSLPWTSLSFILATLAIAGIPPFAGFFSKDEILWEVFHRGHTTLGVLAMVTAVLTSFYMFRLCFLTFFGQERLTHHAKSHLHESPWTMTSVLMILGLLSLCGGWIGAPHVLGFHNYLHDFLPLGSHGPVMGEAEKFKELALMGASVFNAVAAALVAALFYLKFPQVPEKIAQGFSGIYRLIRNKYYVDEIYDALVVQPLKKSSEVFFAGVVDQAFIDGAVVNGSARTLSWVGSWISRLQNGLVNRYAFYFFLAIAGLVVMVVVGN